MKELHTVEEFQTLLEMKRPFFIFKHSTICPTSSRAHQNVETFIKDHPDFPVYRVLVIEDRPLSNHIADHFSIPHQSPQIFLISEKKCQWHISHLGITEIAMQDHLPAQ